MGGDFTKTTYIIKKKFFKVLGASFTIVDETGNLCFFVKQKAFKLKEDIRIFTDEGMADELLLIQARKIIDFSASYDVVDSHSGSRLGALKRKGFKSMIQDEWVIFDGQDIEIGKITEDSMLLALLRRVLTSLIPQSFHGFVGEARVFTFKQKFNPFVQRIVLDFNEDSANRLDRRMGIAAAVLLSAVEGRQNS
ncbi:MAG: LURP-one-related/scramblase family protein [Saccharofermentanales bacterium]